MYVVPSGPPLPRPVPHGRTARRLDWRFLPPHIRSLVEQRIGSAVVATTSQDSGFTPGFASVLECADGTRHFVKAAAAKAQPLFAQSYRDEARKLAMLPDTIAAPRLLWSFDDDWVVLETEYVEGRPPARPWQDDTLDTCLGLLATLASTLPPPGLDLATAAEEFAGWPGMWEEVARQRPNLSHLQEAADLAAGFGPAVAGKTLVHTDVRADNLLIDTAGKPWLCDWNWPVRGAPWVDSIFLLVEPAGDGIDAEAVIARHQLLREVEPEAIDTVLALLAGYFLKSAADRVPPTSPHLRSHQAWCAHAVWHWLAARRGWDMPSGG